MLGIEQRLAALLFHGRDGFGRLLPSGIYLYRFEAGNYSATGKVLLSR